MMIVWSPTWYSVGNDGEGLPNNIQTKDFRSLFSARTSCNCTSDNQNRKNIAGNMYWKWCIELLTDEEDDSDLSHISISSANTNFNLNNEDISRPLECITISDQETSGIYHYLDNVLPTEHCHVLKILHQLLKSTPVKPVMTQEVKVKGKSLTLLPLSHKKPLTQ